MIPADPYQPGTLKFSLFGIPVAIHWMFWLIAALIGPIEIANSPIGVRMLLIWVAVVLVSIIIHELGHAFAFRRYGGRPSILLYGMGGLASAEGRYTRNQSIVITLGGPVIQLVLAGIFWLIFQWVPRDAAMMSESDFYLYYFVRSMLVVNFFWAVLNLLPIFPLDGGRLLGHLMYGRKPLLRAQIGAACAVAAGVALFIWTKSIFNLVIFGFLAFMNFQMAQRGYR